MTQKSFNVGELRRIVKESSKEFKPVLGANVESDNKKNNEKSYKDAEKRAKDYDGGLKKDENKELPAKEDINRTMLGVEPRVALSKDQKERIKAQALGYSSELEMNNGIEKAADFEGNKKIYKQFTDSEKAIEDAQENLRSSGLQAREIKKKEPNAFKKNTVYESAKPKAKRLTFKHTQFINESQVLVRIPEQYKIDGQVIHMCDCKDNEYIVECVRSEKSGKIETNIISHSNKRVMNEQMNRIQELMNFTSDTDGKFNKQSSLNEDKVFNDILKITKTK